MGERTSESDTAVRLGKGTPACGASYWNECRGLRNSHWWDLCVWKWNWGQVQERVGVLSSGIGGVRALWIWKGPTDFEPRVTAAGGIGMSELAGLNWSQPSGVGTLDLWCHLLEQVGVSEPAAGASGVPYSKPLQWKKCVFPNQVLGLELVWL